MEWQLVNAERGMGSIDLFVVINECVMQMECEKRRKYWQTQAR